jgi:diguanylate cyclase (GGDEF)-like protein/PAS domain S-box-containing protein
VIAAVQPIAFAASSERFQGKTFMSLAAALVYWVIITIWLAVMATVTVAFFRNGRTFGTSRLLLIVVAIDTGRNIIENIYFGLYFGAQYGLFPMAFVGVLGQPTLLIMPKLINVVAASVVLGLLVLRWLPLAQRERARADTEVLEKSHALSQEIEENRRLFNTSIDIIVVTDRERFITRISASCASILGYLPEEMIGNYGGDFISPECLDVMRSELTGSVEGGAIRNFQSDFLHKDGYPVTLSWTGVWSGKAQRFFLIGRDMREQKAAEEKLRNLAHVDQLTGLPNRVSLMNDVAGILRPAVGTGRPVSIALFDLDGFKDVNDTLGHSAGDKLLGEVAVRMSEFAPEASRSYRLGGDEFVLVIPDCRDPTAVSLHVDRIMKALEKPFKICGDRILIGSSAGIAMAPADGGNTEELIASADLALYDAKAAGGRRHRFFMPSMRSALQARREMDAELRRAATAHEFVLHYQPQLRLSDGAVVGAEALLRWQHPTRGLLAPAAFIDALGRSPEALRVGRFVLREACKAAASWRSNGLPSIRMGVNLFPAQFTEEVLLQDVEQALSMSGLAPDQLEIEITENVALSNQDKIIPSLRALRQKGVGVAFDDFGTGYASLSCITQYPLTRIKIDRSFVKNISAASSGEDTAVASSIIVMAHNLGLAVIAEGVETLAQAAFLRARDCEEVQGFLYARPMPAAEFQAFLILNASVEKQQAG